MNARILIASAICAASSLASQASLANPNVAAYFAAPTQYEFNQYSTQFVRSASSHNMNYAAQHYQPPKHYAPQPPVSHNPYMTPARAHILKRAKSALGVRYKYGGNSIREGLDCSSFVQYAYRGLDLKVPRVSRHQSKKSRTIPRRAMLPGDLIFFNTTGKGVSHVGIYLGNGKFIHAASGGGKVMIDDLRKRYWQKRLVKYGTYLS